MKILSTPHAHTTYCDGKQSAEEMVLTAIEKGFVSLGLSEHGEQTIDSGSSLKPHQVAPYIAEVKALQKKYAERIRLHLGIERDFYSNAVREEYDYVLASFHYMKKDGVLCAADGKPEPIHAFKANQYGGSGEKMAVDFFLESGKYCLDYKPEIFGHFDLLKKHNGEHTIYDPNDKKVIDVPAVYLCALEDGRAEILSCLSLSNPSFLAIDEKKRHIYAVNEGKEFQGNYGGGLTDIVFDEQGRMQVLSAFPTGGTDPCHVAVSPDGKFVAVANYADGKVSVFPGSLRSGILCVTRSVS